MSYATIATCATDEALRHRVEAGVHKEAEDNAAFADTAFGRQVHAGTAPIWSWYAYPVSIANEASYASALAADNPDPGGDESVITDGDILSAIQANWPPDPPPPAA